MASSDGRDTLQDAGAIWKFLDNLSMSNPDEYSKYIGKVLKEGTEMGFGPPVPKFVVQTEKTPQVIPIRKYFINIAEWKQIPEPKSQDSPIPMCAGKLRKELVDKEWAMVIDVCMSLKVLSKCENDIEKCAIVELVLKYIEDNNGFHLSRKYKFVTEKYKGNKDVLLNLMCPTSLNESLSKTVSNNKITPESVLDQVKYLSHQNNQSLVSDTKKKTEMTNLTDEKPCASPSPSPSAKYDPIITANLTSPSLTESNTKILNNGKKKNKLKKPRVEMDVNKAEGNVELTVYLPDVTSVQECDLELQEDHLSLTVFEKYELELDLPVRINVDESKAKFVKDMSMMLITANISLPD